jgi:hypothetical protein
MEVGPLLLDLSRGFSYGNRRMFIGADEWNTEMPWLVCRRKKGVVEGAGYTYYECWPKEIKNDARVSETFSYSVYRVRELRWEENKGRLTSSSLMIGFNTVG